MEKYLPEKSQVILKCDMSAWQKVYYQQVTSVGRVDTGMLYMHSLGISSIFLFHCVALQTISSKFPLSLF